MTRSSKRAIAIGILIVAFLAAVAFVIFLLTAPDPAAGLERARVGQPATQPAEAQPGEEEVVIQLQTTEGAGPVELSFVGSSAAGEQPGFFQTIDGEAVLDAEGNLRRLRGTVDVASVLTNSDRLTNNLKTQAGFFEVERFPRASFVSTRIEPAPGGAPGDATHRITGNLTIRDATRSIEFPARVTASTGSLELSSEFSIDRREFGVNYDGGTLFPEIRDLVRITLNIRADRPATPATGPALP